MGEKRNTEGWSGRQLIKQLQRKTNTVGPDPGASGSRILVPPRAERDSRQFEASTQEETQSRTRSVGTSVHSRQFEASTQEETQSRTRSVGTSVHSQQFEASTQEETQSRTRSVGSTVHSQQFEASTQEETQSRQRRVGTEVGQSETRRKAQGKKGKGGIFKGLISGTIISESLILKDIRYTALAALLAIIFIANKFNAEAVERQIIVLEQEVRDMRAESLSVSAELGSVSRQSEITELVKERGLGLEELREPPYRIVVNE